MQKEPFRAGTLSAQPGETVRGYLDVPQTPIRLPVTLICGARPGKTVLLTGGTHGAEFLGVEVAIRLGRTLDAATMSGNVAVVHPANVPQFFFKSAYVGPDDGKNLNRVYPGRALGTVSERIAFVIASELLRHADFYIDLHSGDVHETLIPYVIHSQLGNEESNRLSAEAAALFGAAYHVFSTGSTGALGYAATLGIPGVLPEIGEGGRWSEEEVKFFMQGVHNVLSMLGVIDRPIVDMGPSEQLPPMDVLMASEEGCWYPAVKPGDRVAKGRPVGEIRDFFGTVLARYEAPKDGVVLFMASSLSILRNDPVIGIG